MNRAALFFDIDGTVLSEITKEIPASTVDALKRAHDAGHFFIYQYRKNILQCSGGTEKTSI